MPFDTKSVRNVVSLFGATVCMSVLLVVPYAQAQLPELRVEIADTTAQPGEQNTVISIYLDNYEDTVAGFNLWLLLDRNDIMIFQIDSGIAIDTTYYQCITWQSSVCIDSQIVPKDTAFWWECTVWQDTVCIDSVWVPRDSTYFMHIATTVIQIGNFDTTGTVCSGWQKVDARSIGGAGTDLNIAAIANLPQGDTIEGIAPQQGGLLMKLLADVYDIPDTVTDRTVRIMILHDALDHFNFSRPDGSSIGILYDTIPDTNCWQCTLWSGNECLNWERMPVPLNCDTIEVCCPDSFTIEMVPVPYLDTVNVILIDGSLTVLNFVCGNVNGDELGKVNVADLTYLVAYLFQGGPEPQPLASGNVDCTGGDAPNVADLTYLVAYLFQSGPEPCAGCK